MTIEWQQIPLGSACAKIGSGATPRGGKEAYRGGNTSLIRSQNIYNDRFTLEGLVYIDDAQAHELRNVVVEEGDVLLNITGDSVARCCQVDPKILPARVNQHVAIIRPRADLLDARFLRYVFISPSMQEHLLALASAGATRNALTKGMIESLVINAPAVEQQRAIARILGTLDDKIELNRKMNETLEVMARALFRSWFVDFDPVKLKSKGKKPFGMDDETAALFPDSFEESELGLIPKGWEVSAVDNVCIFQNGYAFKSNLMTTIPVDAKRIFKMGNIIKGGGFNPDGSNDYYPNSEIKNLSRYLAKKGDLLMCMTDMKNNIALLGNTALMPVSDEYLVNQRVGLLRVKEPNIVNYPFLFLLTNESIFLEELRSRANSGVQVNLSTEEIKKSKFILPLVTIHISFNKMVSPFFEQMEAHRKESGYLKSIRDLLLPKLISGQLRIKDAEKFLELHI